MRKEIVIERVTDYRLRAILEGMELWDAYYRSRTNTTYVKVNDGLVVKQSGQVVRSGEERE